MKKTIPKWHNLPDHMPSNYPAVDASQERRRRPRLFFNRNLSWLQFNDRVLMEAADPTVPPLERLRFLSIVSSNLDEFFKIRVSQLARVARRRPSYRYQDGLSAQQALAEVRAHVLRQKSKQASVLKDVIHVLAKEGVHIHTEFLDNRTFDDEIRQKLPPLRFIVRSFSEDFPALEGDQINIFVRFPNEYAIINFPEPAKRLLLLSSELPSMRFVLLDRWIATHAESLFPHRTVLEAFPFKIIRDADIRDFGDEEDLEDRIVRAVSRRLRAKAVRLEIDARQYTEGSFFLGNALGLSFISLYRFDLPLDAKSLGTICQMKPLRHLGYAPIAPAVPGKWSKRHDIFRRISANDMLLHHPYDSFDTVVRFLEAAANDPSVTHIYHTMYRTSRESPIMEALKVAARRGKKVIAYIEIKARFDELNNVRWATELKKAGVRVGRPLAGFKVHCKLTLVIRRESEGTGYYLHLGTGNYHPTTARLYTDLGLLTRHEEIGKEAVSFFSTLARRETPKGLRHLLVSPGNLRDSLLDFVKDEIAAHKRDRKGRIIAKMNALVDAEVIRALYEASAAGVKVDLLIRGICCLRPGVPGLSENITVRSVVDRFLEHSRVYYFRHGGDERIYLSSADWMPRNFQERYEVAFPLLDPVLKRFVRDELLANVLRDNLRAWELRPDGTYVKVQPKPGAPLRRSQQDFEIMARRRYRDTILESRWM